MSTRAGIGMTMPDGTVRAIYLHHDGYTLGGAGDTLAKHYSTLERVESLLELGDLSSLRAKIFPDVRSVHSWEHPQPDVTIAYHRDRGEALHPPAVFSDLYDFELKGPEIFGAEYLYLFVNGLWLVRIVHENTHKWKELEAVLRDQMA